MNHSLVAFHLRENIRFAGPVDARCHLVYGGLLIELLVISSQRNECAGHQLNLKNRLPSARTVDIHEPLNQSHKHRPDLQDGWLACQETINQVVGSDCALTLDGRGSQATGFLR